MMCTCSSSSWDLYESGATGNSTSSARGWEVREQSTYFARKVHVVCLVWVLLSLFFSNFWASGWGFYNWVCNWSWSCCWVSKTEHVRGFLKRIRMLILILWRWFNSWSITFQSFRLWLVLYRVLFTLSLRTFHSCHRDPSEAAKFLITLCVKIRRLVLFPYNSQNASFVD